MLDLRSSNPIAWDEALKPRGEGTLDKEPFPEWWRRHGTLFPHLPDRLLEQWVYKHWSHSPYCHLPLGNLLCRTEEWTTRRFLSDVRCCWDTDMHAEETYEMFSKRPYEPGLSMNGIGTWNIPAVIIDCPDGVLSDRGPAADARFWLIEGHQRRRYLHSLAARNEGAGRACRRHAVYLLRLSPDAGRA